MTHEKVSALYFNLQLQTPNTKALRRRGEHSVGSVKKISKPN